MEYIREILARNLKENRKKLGITQPMLAERAGLSTHYLGMIEIGRNFPTADVIERLAEALCINSNELFSVAVSPEKAIEELQKAVVKNIDQQIYECMERYCLKTEKNIEKAVTDTIKKTLTAQREGKG